MELSASRPADHKARLEQLKCTKSRLGRQLSGARKVGDDLQDLLAEFQAVTSEIKALQKRLKQQLNHTSTREKWVPPILTVSSAVLDQVVKRPVNVQLCTGGDVKAAEAYVACHPASSLWHRPVITSFIAETYRHPAQILIALSADNRVVGIVSLVQLKSRLFGNFMVSVPYFNYGGLLADHPTVADALIEAANRWREQESAAHLELRHVQNLGLGLPQRGNKVSFWLGLPDTTQQLWNSFKPKLRAQIRRGERERAEFVLGGSEHLDDFYRVFSENMRDLGTPVYGRAFFRKLLQRLPEQTWLVVVKVGQKAVGCAFLAGYRNRLEIPWASTLRSVSHTSINMFMYWKILEFAVSRGYRVFDFGRCSEHAGTYHFKKQWGAQPIPLHWDYVLAPREVLPALNPENPKYHLLIAIWKKLPVWAANTLGPPIVRMLP